MKAYFDRAVRNITRYGDTDIFPFPIENHVFFDRSEETVKALLDINAEFESCIAKYPPSNISALAPVRAF